MPFPDSPRVIYEKNPLAEVICQLRFPAILRIDSAPPVEYQERLRKNYPLFKENQSQDLKLDLPVDLSSILNANNPFPFRVQTSYEFVSADGKWKVQLSRESLTLSTTEYTRWEEFKDHLKGPLDELVSKYAPSFYTRIGLRYKDIIKRSDLGLEGVEWSELLRPAIAGELNSRISNDVTQCVKQLTIDLKAARGGQVALRHALVSNEKGEVCYLIDGDFFTTQRTEVDHATQILDELNQQSGRLFRWCITDKLHESMGPGVVP